MKLRKRLLPSWTGAPARLAAIVIALAMIVCTCEIVGALHQFRRGPVLVGFVVVGAGAWYLSRRFPSSEGPSPTSSSKDSIRSSVSRAEALAGLLSVSIVVADWSTRTIQALHHGMSSVDTLWYHLPFAARWVQQGAIGPLHYVDSGAITVFYPANSEIFHALGILFLGSDFLSPLLNSAWLALTLTAAWCIGRPFNAAPITLIGTTAVLVTPGLVATQPGGGYDDIVGLALLLCALAVLVNTSNALERPAAAQAGIAAAAAGLAFGTKYTFVAPVLALTACVIVWGPRGARAVRVATWVVVAFLTGSFWYLRNLFAVGNPLPSLRHIGPLSLPGPPSTTPTTTVAHFLFRAHIWSDYYLPGLRLSLGPVWWLLLALLAVGFIVGMRPRAGPEVRVLAATGIVGGIGFLFTPQILTIYGVPVFFAVNLRYALPAIVPGVLCLGLAPMVRTTWFRWCLIGVFGLVLLGTQFDASIWPTNLTSPRFVPPVTGIDSLLGLLVGVAIGLAGLVRLDSRIRNELSRLSVRAIAVATLVLVVLVGGFEVQQVYQRDRYASFTLSASAPSVIYSWAQHVQRARIAVFGFLAYLQYPLYGRLDSNYVQYVGQRGPHGSFTTPSSCVQWRSELNEGKFTYVLISSLR
ncbi:MAG: hypothetical protein ACRD6W_11900, partial [Nitrososphaerales archaeon]